MALAKLIGFVVGEFVQLLACGFGKHEWVATDHPCRDVCESCPETRFICRRVKKCIRYSVCVDKR